MRQCTSRLLLSALALGLVTTAVMAEPQNERRKMSEDQMAYARPGCSTLPPSFRLTGCSPTRPPPLQSACSLPALRAWPTRTPASAGPRRRPGRERIVLNVLQMGGTLHRIPAEGSCGDKHGRVVLWPDGVSAVLELGAAVALPFRESKVGFSGYGCTTIPVLAGAVPRSRRTPRRQVAS